MKMVEIMLILGAADPAGQRQVSLRGVQGGDTAQPGGVSAEGRRQGTGGHTGGDEEGHEEQGTGAARGSDRQGHDSGPPEVGGEGGEGTSQEESLK